MFFRLRRAATNGRTQQDRTHPLRSLAAQSESGQDVHPIAAQESAPSCVYMLAEALRPCRFRHIAAASVATIFQEIDIPHFELNCDCTGLTSAAEHNEMKLATVNASGAPLFCSATRCV